MVTVGLSGWLPSMADPLRDGRTLLAVEHRALMTFARANGMSEERLREGVFEMGATRLKSMTAGDSRWDFSRGVE